MKDKANKIKKILSFGNIKNDKKFSSFDEWDSLTHMKFVINFEKSFKIKLSTKEIMSIQHVNSCLKLIKKYENKKK